MHAVAPRRQWLNLGRHWDGLAARAQLSGGHGRVGDAAFRAQREAFEAANMALKKLQMHAHGEVLTNLLSAWEKRDASLVPTVQDLNKTITAAVRSTLASWRILPGQV